MKDIVKNFKKRIKEGYLELAPPIDTLKTDDDESENEFQLDEIDAAITGSKQKCSSSTTDTNITKNKANTPPEPKPYWKNQAMDSRLISRRDQ
eukprot:1052291-Ditylum_brightwellii.AAC.1